MAKKSDAKAFRERLTTLLDAQAPGWRQQPNAVLARALDQAGHRTLSNKRWDAQAVRDFKRASPPSDLDRIKDIIGRKVRGEDVSYQDRAWATMTTCEDLFAAKNPEIARAVDRVFREDFEGDLNDLLRGLATAD